MRPATSCQQPACTIVLGVNTNKHITADPQGHSYSVPRLLQAPTRDRRHRLLWLCPGHHLRRLRHRAHARGQQAAAGCYRPLAIRQATSDSPHLPGASQVPQQDRPADLCRTGLGHRACFDIPSKSSVYWPCHLGPCHSPSNMLRFSGSSNLAPTSLTSPRPSVRHPPLTRSSSAPSSASSLSTTCTTAARSWATSSFPSPP